FWHARFLSAPKRGGGMATVDTVSPGTGCPMGSRWRPRGAGEPPATGRSAAYVARVPAPPATLPIASCEHRYWYHGAGPRPAAILSLLSLPHSRGGFSDGLPLV